MIEPPKPPEPPSPPGLLDSPESKKKPSLGFLEELGISPAAFGEVALCSPVQWTGEQLDQIQMLMEGEELEPEVLAEIFRELSETERQQPKQAPRPVASEEDSGIDYIGGGSLPYVPPSPVPLEVPTCRVNLDDWIKKVKAE